LSDLRQSFLLARPEHLHGARLPAGQVPHRRRQLAAFRPAGDDDPLRLPARHPARHPGLVAGDGAPIRLVGAGGRRGSQARRLLQAAGSGLPRRVGGDAAGLDPVLRPGRRDAGALPNPLARSADGGAGPGAGRGRGGWLVNVNGTVLIVVLASAIFYGTPLLFAAVGELLAERSGVLNLGVEGMMLIGAVTGFWTVQHVGGPGWVGLTTAVCVAA